MSPRPPSSRAPQLCRAAGRRHRLIAQTSPGNNRADQVDTGRDWLRLNLAATAAGLSVHPYSQPLQEFPEMAPHFAAIHAALDVAAPARIQMLGRIGYGPDQPPSPRWPAASPVL